MQELENPVVLIYEKKISGLNSIIPILELVMKVWMLCSVLEFLNYLLIFLDFEVDTV